MLGVREFCRMPDGHECAFNPRSSNLVADVPRDVESKRLSLAVNYRSLRTTAQQLRGRRRMMAPFTMQEHERLCEDGEVGSVCYFSNTRCEFAHPETPEGIDRRYLDVGAALIRWRLPLSTDGSGQWTHFEIIREGTKI